MREKIFDGRAASRTAMRRVACLVAVVTFSVPAAASVRAHLPDVRARWAGWSSELSVRNNAGSSARVTVDFRLPNGDVRSRESFSLAANGSLTFFPEGSFYGSALVDANQDLSVSVVHRFDMGNSIDGYAGVRAGARSVFVPIVHRNNSGWYSDVMIQNTSSASATVNASFYRNDGSAPVLVTSAVAGRGQVTLRTRALSRLPNGFVGSVRIQATQNVAVASTQFLGDAQLMATSSSQPPALTSWGPLVQNDNSGYLSGIQIQNTTGSDSFADIVYFRLSGGGRCASTFVARVPAHGPWTGFPAPPRGNSCKRSDRSGDVLAASFRGSSALTVSVNQLLGATQASTYAAITRPSRNISIPRLRRDGTWTDGFVMQNTTSSTISASVTFYRTNGSVAGTITGLSLPPNGARVVFGEVPSGFTGSAVVSASGNVAVAINNLRGGPGDVIASYPADHR